MSSPEERWWSVRAGEYVLGTLRGADLELFERILAVDTTMQAEVARWERRLGGLAETTLARPPGEHVWPLVLSRIRASGEIDVDLGVDATAPPASVPVGDLAGTPPRRPADASPRRPGADDRRRGSGAERSRLWPALAALATAASLVLGFLLVESGGFPGASPLAVDGLAVVLSDEDGEPYFLVETDYENGRVRVTALTPPSLEEDRDFRLWQALPDRSAVRAVALLPEERGRSRVFEVDTLIEGSDLFGVSLEPPGAPVDAGPTGPVIAHGDFLPTERDD